MERERAVLRRVVAIAVGDTRGIEARLSCGHVVYRWYAVVDGWITCRQCAGERGREGV